MKTTTLALAALLLPTAAMAQPLEVCDFESYDIGDRVEMWNKFGGEPSSYATVEKDPAGTSNKVLHVHLNDWNTYVELAIPTDLKGKEITDRYQTVDLDLYRATSDPNDYKQFWILIGSDEVYENDGYPHQGDKGVWQHRTYGIHSASEENESAILHIGLHSEESDYYIDNITLKGPYDDYNTIEGGFLDLCIDNTDKNYQVYTTGINMAEPLTVRTARYTELRPDMIGSAPLTIYAGGERTFIGTKDGASYPNWTGYTGDITVYPYTDVKSGCGFYGIILNAGGKTFNPEDIEASLERTNSELKNNKLIITDGATLASPKGTRGVRIGTLELQEGSRLCGPLAAAGHSGYFVVGATNADATLAGRIAPIDKNGEPYKAVKLGVIKEGKGTYTISGNNNLVTGAVRVTAGRVLIDNDVAAARTGKLGGAIGYLGTTPGIYVFTRAELGGCGHSASIVDVYGTLNPGSMANGTFTIADFEGGNDVGLRVRPTSKLKFDLTSADDYDRLAVEGPVDYWNIKQDFCTSDLTPVIHLLPADNNTIKAGDTFTLISAKSKTALNDIEWAFRVQYPKCFTWEVKEVEEDGSYSVVATVTSLEYSGQGDTIIADDEVAPDWNDWVDDDDFDETTDNTPLREYASAMGKNIGIAAACWNYDVSVESQSTTKKIAREFNMVVSENGTKFQFVQPQRGKFDFGLGDKVVLLAQRHDMTARGHTFAWNQQNADWLTTDGNKNTNNFSRDELLAILKNHIETTLEHYRGKISEWDVVNECLSDNQTTIRSNPDGYDIKPSVWQLGIGEDYIDSAFVWAHRADPTIKLYLNDYSVEFKGTAKSEALFNLAKRLKNSGIPITGVGLQSHLDAGNVDTYAMSANIARYAPLGLECIITELDLGIYSTTNASLEQQAKTYEAIARVWLSNSNCPSMVIWGLRDSDSWRDSNPLLYDSSLNAKPAYYGVHRALRQAYAAAGISDVVADEAAAAQVTAIYYYNLQGIRLNAPVPGIVIVVEQMSDGTTRSHKTLYR